MRNQIPESVEKLRDDIVFRDTLCGFDLEFHSTWGIFSPRAIDEGTALLLKYLEVNPTDRCLDLGCGYGPLGLVMAKMAPEGRSTLIDKDFVAVDYAQKNAVVNGISNADVFLSNGFSAIGRDQRGPELVCCRCEQARIPSGPHMTESGTSGPGRS